jgi:hypothetical protein
MKRRCEKEKNKEEKKAVIGSDMEAVACRPRKKKKSWATLD